MAEAWVSELLSDIVRAHKPMKGEAYPWDTTIYCATCVGIDSGAAKWPCKTLRLVDRFRPLAVPAGAVKTPKGTFRWKPTAKA